MPEKQEDKILERFKILVDEYSKSKSLFISDSKIAQSQLSEVYDGKKSISSGIKLKLQKNLNVNLEWLESGKGEKYLIDKTETTTPVYDSPATASGVEVYNDLSSEEPAFRVNIPQFKDCTFGKLIYGHSMKGSFDSGCYVFCKEIHDHSIILWGEVYYLETDNYCMVKRLQRGESVDIILACSDNEERRVDGNLRFEPVLIEKDKIRKLCLVKGSINQNH